MTVIEIENLRKTSKSAVDGISLRVVGRGQIFGIAGTNGAGKTTLVERASGLRQRDSGEGAAGLDPRSAEPRRDRVADRRGGLFMPGVSRCCRDGGRTAGSPLGVAGDDLDESTSSPRGPDRT